ncbi:MAG: hypothetical protein IKF90_04520 [Parasporobacterium sp.]|nr:hypothetical protein [Parasporobacterium sp.]
MTQDSNFLRTEYFKVLFPIMYSVLGGTINALIDSVIISQKLGSSGLAAVNLSMPVYLLLCIIGSLAAYGASFLSAREVGRENMKAAGKYFQTCFTVGLAAGAVCTVAGFFLCSAIAQFLSGDSSFYSYVFDYCQVTFLGSIPFIMSYVVINYLQLAGKLKSISLVVVIMVGSDLLLDLLFIYPLNIGMKGLALASVLATLFATVYGFISLEKGSETYKLKIKEMGFWKFGEILRFGSPAALGNLFDAVKLLLLNILILRFGGEESAAIWAALNILSELSLVIILGVPRAGAPMIGVYNSSRENGGIRILIKLEIKTGLLFTAVFSILLLVFSGLLKNVFAIPNSIFLPLLCLSGSLMCNVVSSILEFYFNAVGRIQISNALAAIRRLILPVMVLAGFGNSVYLWLFLPISAAVSLLMGIMIIGATGQYYAENGTELSRVLLLDDRLEQEHRVLDFSVPADMEKVCEASEQISEFCELHQMSPKQVMRLGLSIEELLNVMIQKNPELRFVDLRAYILQGVIGIRIRCTGKNYNPFEDSDSDEDFLMGILMLKKMCQAVTHTYALGMNTINLIYENSEESL